MIYTRYILVVFSFVLMSALSVDVRAQSSRDSEPERKFTASSSSEKVSSSRKTSKKTSRKAKKNNTPQSLVEYEQLRKDVQKAQTKKEKGMRKPQYSDPSYFGHKKKPKKRKLGKKKFCKECGMSH